MLDALSNARRLLISATDEVVQRWRSLWTASSPGRGEPVLLVGAEDARQFSMSTATLGEWVVDAQTWKDLDLDQLMQQASAGCSVLAQHAVHRSLLSGSSEPDDDDAPLPDQVAAYLADPSLAHARRPAFEQLKTLKFDPTMALFCDRLPAMPDWARHLRWFGPALSAACGLVLATPAAIAAVLGLLAVSGFVQIRLYDQLQHWKLCREAFVTMLRASIEAEGEGSERAAMARRVIRELDAHWLVRSPQAAETLNLIALSEYASMPAKLRRLRQRLEALRSLYLRLARREAASGIAALLRRSGAHCRPEVVDDPRKLTFHALGNPLIPGMAQIPSLMLQGKGAFITGQNGVGKSTLLRSVGVNLIAARAFGHCFADAALVPSGPVMTSLHIEDSPSQGHSLYVAELRRASELLEAARASGTGVVLIDEVFAGTNHLDAVSVAATVLDELSRYAAVLVSSHNVVLAPLLRERLIPLQVVRAGAGVSIKAGILVETNGISLLREHGFGESHVARAQAVFSWLSSFMSDPPPDQAPITIPGRPFQRLTASPTDSYQ